MCWFSTLGSGGALGKVPSLVSGGALGGLSTLGSRGAVGFAGTYSRHPWWGGGKRLVLVVLIVCGLIVGETIACYIDHRSVVFA